MPRSASETTSPGDDRQGERPGSPASPVSSPVDLDWRDWRQVALRTVQGLGNNDLSLFAAGMAFYMMLAMVPMLGALGAFYGLVADPASLQGHLAGLASIAPPEAVEIVRGQVAAVAETSPDTLSFGAAAGALFAVWSGRSGVGAAIRGLNIVYGDQETRSLLWSIGLGFLITLALLLVAVVALGVVVAVPAVLSVMPLGGFAGALVDFVRWPIGIGAVLFGIGVLYRYGPARRYPKIAWITPGALIATTGWLAGSMALSYYMANLADFHETYGSLGAVIGLLMWFYLSAFAVLTGAQVNAELERQAPRDAEIAAPA